jgi:hypothetical protein
MDGSRRRGLASSLVTNRGISIFIAVGRIGRQVWHGRGNVPKPDGEPVMTVMDFGRSFPLDPLLSSWRHRKFWTRSLMPMSFAVKEGAEHAVPNP